LTDIYQDPLAQYYLGICMERGLGVNKNVNEAAELYLAAAGSNIPQAQHNLAVFYEHGCGGNDTLTEHLSPRF